MPSEWNALSSELRFLAVLALWILLSSFEFVSSWCMFFILDSISKTLNSPALRACEELVNLMERGGLKSPTGLFYGCSQGSMFFPGTDTMLASCYILEECNDTVGSYIRPALTSISGHEHAQGAGAGGLDFAGGKVASQEIITRS